MIIILFFTIIFIVPLAQKNDIILQVLVAQVDRAVAS